MTTQSLTLADPRVRAMKERFEVEGRSPVLRTGVFSQLFTYFLNGGDSFSKAARLIGTSHNNIGNWYRRYFEPFFGKSGRERWRVQLARSGRQKLRAQIRRLLYGSGPLAQVAKGARAQGYNVSVVVSKNAEKRTARRVSTRGLSVNGHLCLVYRLTNKWHLPGSRQFYSRAEVRCERLQDVEFVILHIAVPGFAKSDFVIPSYALRAIFASKGRMDRRTAYIPVAEGNRHPGPKPAIQYDEYRGAWHLLAP